MLPSAQKRPREQDFESGCPQCRPSSAHPFGRSNCCACSRAVTPLINGEAVVAADALQPPQLASAPPQWEAQQRVATLEAQLAAAVATIQQQHAENEQLRARCFSLEQHLRGTFGECGI